MPKFLIPHILKSKKFWTVSAITLVLFSAIIETGLAARINLPFGIMDKIRSLLNSGNISISAADYKDGTIILIKPIATGVGEGRYEAGDIVEIRDGAELYKRFGNGDFLGWEEKSKLIPLYLPQKLTDEQKQDLLAPEYEAIPNNQTPITKKIPNSNNQTETGRDEALPRLSGNEAEVEKRITKRRQYGIDYTLILSDRDILKIRQEKALDNIPEVKFEQIINKNNQLSYNATLHTPPRYNIGTHPLARGDYRSAEKSPLKRGVPQRGRVCNVMSAVCLPQRLAVAENLISKTKQLANTIIKPVLAQGAPTELVKTVDTGGYADYLSLSAWEAGTQQDLTSTNKIAIAKCQHKTATSTADTTAVEISGWTTDATRYIKIWTDPNEPYRHNGKWDNGKYKIEITGNEGIIIREEFIKIEGLQIKISSDFGYRTGIYFAADNVESDIFISNNILLGNFSNGVIVPRGISGQFNISGTRKIYNNIIINFYEANALSSIGINISGGVWYVNNNTIYNTGYGIRRETYGSLIAKNNLVASTTDPFSSTFAAGTDYNATDINDTPGVGTHNRVNQSFYFTDLANNDFHLAPGDTGAMDYGVDLSADTNLPFALDIDNQARAFGLGASSTKWDIGADEFSPTAIYRSVGPSKTDALSSGFSGTTLSISGSTATFSTSQPDNIGVGDVIIYADTQGGTTATNSVAFIHGRNGPTSYTVKDVEGHIASSTNTTTTRWAIYRAYTSLANAEAGDENDGLPDSLEAFENWSGGKNLASSTEQWNIACYANGTNADTGVIVDGWATTQANSINIFTPYLASQAGVNQRHQGKWDIYKYYIEGYTVGTGIKDDYVKIDGLQIKTLDNSAYNQVLYADNLTTGTNKWEVSNNIVDCNDYNSGDHDDGIYALDVDANSYIWNNIVYNCKDDSIAAYGTAYINNNTVYNGLTGIKSAPGGILIIKNNIVYNNTDNYSVTFNAASTNNLSGPTQTDAPGSNPKNAAKVNFVDANNYDLHLAGSDTSARDAGADLLSDADLPFNTDIDGDARPLGARWDIGADEGAGSAVVGVNTTKNQITDGLVGYWSFDGPDMDWASTTAEVIDRSGNGNNGNMINMSVKSAIDGMLGQGMKFDGVDDYIDAGNITALDGSAYATWSFWVKPDILGNGQEFLSRWNDNDSGKSWMIINDNNGGGDEIYSYYTTAGNGVRTNSNVLKIGRWTFVSVVYDGTQSTNLTKVKIFINGMNTSAVEIGTIPTTISAPSPIRNVRIGNDTYNVKFITGVLDEVRIYNRALSADEVAELYRLGSARTETNITANGNTNGLVGHWSFDGPDMDWASTTAEVVDRSGYGNNGNMMNMSVKSAIAGKIGQGLKFDGVDDYIRINYDILGTGDVTMSAWVNYTKSATIGIFDNGNTRLIVQPYMNRLVFTNTGAAPYIIVEPIPFNSYTWTLLTAVRTADGSATIYADNNIISGPTTLGSPVAGSWCNIGYRNSPVGTSILIDDVRIYNRALSTEEVGELYRLGTRKLQINPNR